MHQRRNSHLWRLLTVWILLQTIMFSLLLPEPVSAHDCLTDPLNAADCMRTPGFRPAITVIISLGGTIATVLVNVLAGGGAAAGAAAGAVPGFVGEPIPVELPQIPIEGPPPEIPLEGPPPPAESPPGGGLSPSQIANIIQNFPQLGGGPGENPFTEFNRGKGQTRCIRNGLPGYWVNTANLNLHIHDRVYGYRSLGPDIAFELAYNLGTNQAGMFGPNWRFSYESSLQATPEALLVWLGTGKQLRFRNAPPRSAPAPNAPVEYPALDGANRARLFDYGAFLVLLDTETRLNYRYDKSPTGWARLNSVSDENGNAVQLAYTPEGRLRAVTDAAGRSTTFATDAQGRCTGFTLPDGRQARYAYDAQGNLSQAVDLLGVSTVYGYDAEHCLVRMVVDRDQKTTTFTYTTSPYGKLLSSVTDAAGNVTRYELVTLEPRQVRVTDPLGRVTLYSSTPEGQTERIVDPLGNATATRYERGMPVAFTDARQQTARLEYDAQRRPTRMVDAVGGVWASTYDPYGRLLSETDPTGAVWRYEYDAHGNLTRTLSPEGRSMLLAYDARGQLRSITNGLNQQVTFTYDAFGNVLSRTEAAGAVTRMAYDAAGLHLSALTDPRGNTRRFEYDANDRLTRVLHPDGTARSYSYDCCAGVAEVDEAGNRTTLRRDALMLLQEAQDALGRHTLLAYDAGGQLVKKVDALGRVTALDYDAAGNRVRKVDAAGQTAQARYDPAGNLVALVNALGRTTKYDYDAAGRLVRTTDPLGQSVTVTWDAASRPAEVITARGGRIGLSYTADGALQTRSANGTPVAAFEYDAAGNLSRVQDSTGAQHFSYDPQGQLSGIRYPDGTQMAFAYDVARNLSSVRYPDGAQVNLTYDQRNRLTRVAWQGGAIDFELSPTGAVLRETRSNGVSSAYTYAPQGEMQELVHQRGAQVLVRHALTRNANGEVISVNGEAPVTPAAPDGQVSAVYNAMDQLVSRGSERYTYDADGNLVAINGGQWQASYDLENRLLEAQRRGRAVSYRYNGLGQRVQAVAGGNVRNYHYDLHGRLWYTTDAQGRVLQCYIYAGMQLVAALAPDGGALFYHYDHLGNTLAITDGGGERVAAYAYTPFGLVTAQTPQGFENPFTFVGAYGVMDEAAFAGEGLFYMQNRYYDANTGRFLQKDPLGAFENLNLYAYANNNPLTFIDPLGLAYMPPGQAPMPLQKPGSSLLNWLPGWGPSTAAVNATLGVYLTVNAGLTISTGGGWLAYLALAFGASRVYATVKRVYGGDYGDNYNPKDIPADFVDPTKFGRNTTSWAGQKWEDFKDWGGRKMGQLENAVINCYRVPW